MYLIIPRVRQVKVKNVTDKISNNNGADKITNNETRCCQQKHLIIKHNVANKKHLTIRHVVADKKHPTIKHIGTDKNIE